MSTDSQHVNDNLNCMNISSNFTYLMKTMRPSKVFQQKRTKQRANQSLHSAFTSLHFTSLHQNSLNETQENASQTELKTIRGYYTLQSTHLQPPSPS